MTQRQGFTVRFSYAERADLRELARFFKCDEKKALKICFQQMIVSLRQVQEKLAKEEGDAKPYDNDRVGSADAGDSGSGEGVHADSGSGTGAVPGADAAG